MTQVITRTEWGANHPRSTRLMRLPATRTFIHHSVTPGGDDESSEAAIFRMIEGVHWRRFGVAVGYSFGVAPSGRKYEGQGWGRVGAHTEHYNSSSHGICFLGDFTHDLVTDAALNSAAELIREGQQLGFITLDAPIDPHRAVKPTGCPGDNLYAQLDQLRALVFNPQPAPPVHQPRRRRRTKADDMADRYRIAGTPPDSPLWYRDNDGIVSQTVEEVPPQPWRYVDALVHTNFLRIARNIDRAYKIDAGPGGE